MQRQGVPYDLQVNLIVADWSPHILQGIFLSYLMEMQRYSKPPSLSLLTTEQHQ